VLHYTYYIKITLVTSEYNMYQPSSERRQMGDLGLEMLFFILAGLFALWLGAWTALAVFGFICWVVQKISRLVRGDK
jgi:hypothetical protein